MEATKKIILFKIASEINIGRETIVQFLQSKGYEIENKPTAVLTEEMLEVVNDKFKKEKKAAEIKREKFEKHKQTKRPFDTKVKAEPEPEPKEIGEPEKEKMEILIEHSAPITIEPDSDEDGLIIFQDEPQIEIAPQKPIPEKEIIQKHEEKYVHKGQQHQQQQQQPYKERFKKPGQFGESSTPPSEKKQVQVTETSQKEFKTPFQSKDKNEPKPFIKSGEALEILPDSADLEQKVQKSRKKKKRKKLAEVEIEPGQAPKLKGLTIVGKIDLKSERKEIPRRGVNEETEEDEDGFKIKSKPSKLKKKLKLKGKDKTIIQKDKPLIEKKKKRKKNILDMISEEEIDRAIKNTLAGLEDSAYSQMRSRIKQKKRVEREEKEMKLLEEQERESKIIRLTEFVTTADLANLMKVTPQEIILKCMELGLMVSINQRLDKDTITLISDDYGFEIEFLDDKAVQQIEFDDTDEVDDNLIPRAPIVTIMGHVDHGKTSLLDFIRKSNVIAGEAGGITQHIGAYRVDLPDNKHITFLDTPGHEAFTAMRARGAQITDIVVLVIAADDSVMPQTVEAISHAQAANVPIIVAINKVDKPDAKPERIKQQLSDLNILIEEWGGKYQCAEISAKFGNNVDVLMEKILLESDMLELRANPDRKAKATVVEANMGKGLGSVATLIVQKGTLRIGDPFVAGIHSGRVRAMLDERDNKVESAGPSIPVRVIGFEGLPFAGDTLMVVDNDYEARSIANRRQQLRREQEFRQIHHVTLDDISSQIQIGGVSNLNLIIKGDVGGSVEALSDSLMRLSRDDVRVVILHKGVGVITESDVMLAIASGAIIIGFQINTTGKARKLAEAEAVEIRNYNIIYDCINDIKLALEGLLKPDFKEEIIADVEVRRTFKISKVGTIAGCYVLSGKITRNDKIRVLRKGLPIFTGGIQSLKRGKDDVREVDTNYECGITLDGYNHIEEGDVIQAFKLIEVKRVFT